MNRREEMIKLWLDMWLQVAIRSIKMSGTIMFPTFLFCIGPMSL